MNTIIKTAMASALAVGFIACSDNEGASTAPQENPQGQLPPGKPAG